MATQVAFSDLDTWLNNQPENTVDTPYELNVTGITASNIGNKYTQDSFGYIIFQHSIYNKRYVDLSETILPSVTSLYSLFSSCTNLIKSPAIPSSVTNLESTFSTCINLETAPVIPNGVTNMNSTFYGCNKITQAPVLPNNVANLQSTFRGCTSLENAPKIPDGVDALTDTFYNCTSLKNAPIMPDGIINMYETFCNCDSLTYKPVIPSTVIVASNCYYGVTTKNWKGTRSQVETFNPTCPDDCEIQIYNNDRVTLGDTIYNIDISTLSTYLARLTPNTISTAYKIYIRGLTSSNVQSIPDAMVATYETRQVYVDLSYTTLPQGTDCRFLFNTLIPTEEAGCKTLVKSPVLPTDATSLQDTFSGCINLIEAPTIPNSVTSIKGTFKNCTSLTEAPSISSAVTNMSNAFEGCSNITEIAIIPSSVTSAKEAFKNCTSLQKIDEFHIPLNTLKNNPDFQDMFAGCTSLTQIGYKIDTDSWHAWRLKFDANSVEGKIFGFNNGQLTSTAVLNTQISKNDIRLPVLTDELWFPPANMSDSDVEDVIRSVLNNRYTYWNKAVIDPNSKSLVMMASDPNNVVSNFLNGGGGGGVEKLVISTTRSVNVTKDTRIFADGSAITITLNYGSSAEGYVAEVYAIQACTITYYTAQGTTTSLAMEAGGKAIFVYFSGWKLHSNYGTTNTVAVDNLQSVSSNAVASLLNTNLDDTSVVNLTTQMTLYLGVNSVKAIRKNNIVQLEIFGTYSGNATHSGQTLATGLPQKYRPIANETTASFSVVAYNTSGTYVVPSRLAITTGGDILLQETAMPRNSSIRFQVMYLGS